MGHVRVYSHLPLSVHSDAFDSGLIGGVIALPAFKEYFGLDKLSPSALANYEGNIVAVLQGGCLYVVLRYAELSSTDIFVYSFGALSMGYLSDRFGRRICLLLSGIIYIIGSAIQSISGLGSSQKVGLDVLYFSRFLGGIGVGMVSALVPAYVSESVPKAIRGRCTGMIQLANNLGIMLSCKSSFARAKSRSLIDMATVWVNYSSSKDIPYGHLQWRIPFIVQYVTVMMKASCKPDAMNIRMVPGVLFVIAMLFQPESPRWLVEHGHPERAARAFGYVARLSPDDPIVQNTVADIKADFETREEVPVWKQFKQMGESRAIALRCFLPSLFMFFQQWTGTNSINYFRLDFPIEYLTSCSF